jgi:alpha-ketoglutarate-dependent taurine dioxygenase
MGLDPRVFQSAAPRGRSPATQLERLLKSVRLHGLVVADVGADKDEAWFVHLVTGLGADKIVEHGFLRPRAGLGRGLSVIEREPDRPGAFIYGGAWHQNLMFLREPPDVSILYGHQILDARNFTAFVDMAEVAPWLSDGLTALLRTTRAVHSTDAPASPQNAYPLESLGAGAELLAREATHPAYVTDAHTGLSWPHITSNYVTNFEGWHPREALPLVYALQQFSTHDEFVIRQYWHRGMLIAWDNRRFVHRATVSHFGGRRELWRADLHLTWGLEPAD